MTFSPNKLRQARERAEQKDRRHRVNELIQYRRTQMYGAQLPQHDSFLLSPIHKWRIKPGNNGRYNSLTDELTVPFKTRISIDRK